MDSYGKTSMWSERYVETYLNIVHRYRCVMEGKVKGGESVPERCRCVMEGR